MNEKLKYAFICFNDIYIHKKNNNVLKVIYKFIWVYLN